jgi:cell division protein FtsQ
VSSATSPSARRAQIHPRFRARRIKVRRDQGRRRLRRLGALAALVALLGVGYGVTRSPLLDLDRVAVTGAVQTDEQTLLEAGGLRLGTPMTDLDIDRARSAIARLAWVDTVQIRRSWPSAVEVTVTERRAVVALHVDAATWLVLDATGRVLETRTQRPVDLVVIGDLGVQAQPGETVPAALGGVTLAGYVTTDLRSWFVEILIQPDATIEATLHQGIRVSFGTQARLSEKVISLATVLTRVDLRDLEHIDLQVPTSPVLTRRAASA